MITCINLHISGCARVHLRMKEKERRDYLLIYLYNDLKNNGSGAIYKSFDGK